MLDVAARSARDNSFSRSFSVDVSWSESPSFAGFRVVCVSPVSNGFSMTFVCTMKLDFNTPQGLGNIAAVERYVCVIDKYYNL